MSRRKMSPSSSAATFPRNPTVPPRAATPAAVFAAEPPETSAGIADALVERGRPGQVDEGHRPLDQVAPGAGRRRWRRSGRRPGRSRWRRRREIAGLASGAGEVSFTVRQATRRHAGPEPAPGARPASLRPMSDTTATEGADPSARHRLPYSVEPRRYALRLTPDLDNATFTGEVHIEVLVARGRGRDRAARRRADGRQRRARAAAGGRACAWRYTSTRTPSG